MMKKITAICLCAMFLILTGCMETEDDLSRMKEMAKNATVNEDLNITFCAEVKDIQSDDLMQKLDLPKNTVIQCVQKNNIYALWDASDRYGDAAAIIGLNQKPEANGRRFSPFSLVSAHFKANGGCNCLI